MSTTPQEFPSAMDAVMLAELRAADAGEVLALQRAAYVTEAQAHDDLSLPPLTQSIEALESELSDPAVLALGLREGGRLVASVRVRTDGELGELGRLVVAPDRQGRGLGSRLLQNVESRLPDGVTELHLFTGEHSTANLRLYARHGYRETHRSDTGSYQLVHLRKALVHA